MGSPRCVGRRPSCSARFPASSTHHGHSQTGTTHQQIKADRCQRQPAGQLPERSLSREHGFQRPTRLFLNNFADPPSVAHKADGNQDQQRRPHHRHQAAHTRQNARAEQQGYSRCGTPQDAQPPQNNACNGQQCHPRTGFRQCAKGRRRQIRARGRSGGLFMAALFPGPIHLTTRRLDHRRGFAFAGRDAGQAIAVPQIDFGEPLRFQNGGGREWGFGQFRVNGVGPLPLVPALGQQLAGSIDSTFRLPAIQLVARDRSIFGVFRPEIPGGKRVRRRSRADLKTDFRILGNTPARRGIAGSDFGRKERRRLGRKQQRPGRLGNWRKLRIDLRNRSGKARSRHSIRWRGCRFAHIRPSAGIEIHIDPMMRF